jgi:N-succinyldiaminopimelate aminotransferase
MAAGEAALNPLFERLQPYPFARYKDLLGQVAPPDDLPLIDLSIGEPKHGTPELITNALVAKLDGIARYPTTAGSDELRQAVARTGFARGPVCAGPNDPQSV